MATAAGQAKRVLLGMVVAFGGATTGPSAWGALIFYQNPAALAAAHSDLTLETFESANVAPGAIVGVSSPIGSTIDNAVFPPGSLQPGFSISSIGAPLTELGVIGAGVIPGATTLIGPAFNFNTLDIVFGPPVSAVGLNLISSDGPGLISADVFDVRVFGASGLLATGVVGVSGLSTFFGIASTTDPITRVNVSSRTNRFEFVDNLSFRAVPEAPSLVTSLIAAASIGGVATARCRKHRGRIDINEI